jgi:hypothetical protein
VVVEDMADHCRKGTQGDCVVTEFEGSLDFRNGDLPAVPGLPIVPTIETAALLAVLFAFLYPIAQTSVVKSASTGADPALMEVVGH